MFVGKPAMLLDAMYPRVLRGGSWNNNRINCRCAYRNHNDPGNRNNNIGFRVCLAPTSTPPCVRRVAMRGRAAPDFWVPLAEMPADHGLRAEMQG